MILKKGEIKMAKKGYKRYSVHVSPFAHQYGEIMVPENVVEKGEEEIERYIREEFGSIKFSEPSLSYRGVDIDFELDE